MSQGTPLSASPSAARACETVRAGANETMPRASLLLSYRVPQDLPAQSDNEKVLAMTWVGSKPHNIV